MAKRKTRPSRPVRSRRRPAADPSRDRLFRAAAQEFARHGFAGASVDRIAAAAHLNKAMIYYHFRSKAALYRAILRDMFAAVASRVSDVAASSAPPDDKIRCFIEAIATEAEARPHFPPIWFREIADAGEHLDDEVVREVAGVVRTLTGIIDEGAEAGLFRSVNPLLVHAGIVGPLLLYFASAPLRRRLQRVGAHGAGAFERAEILAHVQRVTLGVLQGQTS